MEAAQAPDNIGGIDPHDLPAGETAPDDLQGAVVPVAAEDRHDD